MTRYDFASTTLDDLRPCFPDDWRRASLVAFMVPEVAAAMLAEIAEDDELPSLAREAADAAASARRRLGVGDAPSASVMDEVAVLGDPEAAAAMQAVSNRVAAVLDRVAIELGDGVEWIQAREGDGPIDAALAGLAWHDGRELVREAFAEAVDYAAEVVHGDAPPRLARLARG